jgi:Zn-dependent protease
VEVGCNLLALLLTLIPIKQLTGYSFLNTIWRVLVSFFPFVITILLFLIVVVYSIFAIELLLQ